MKPAIVLAVLMGVSGAHAAGVSDTMPNGQNNMPVQTYQAPPRTTGTTATPNVSGQIYQQRFYRQMNNPPRVQRSR